MINKSSHTQTEERNYRTSSDLLMKLAKMPASPGARRRLGKLKMILMISGIVCEVAIHCIKLCVAMPYDWN